ncbi:fumarylacetoacetate hydrolase family protein [Reinekea sp.]|jgi:2-keto-4-pentenoate hydratase/2-oxohepta-3-ene-1,7-dioic acid hydratase in catechol pathway|uniref:fumarylacetoacetate hydrolase family protein n=1 Tax=Reinekea sp. TaxID=1970455 RepID=UPI002A810105|nr:fumarylacetoacetate hydrolase family protein [Reinekea sp.]
MTPLIYKGAAILPGKIVCIGRNYVAHIEELGNEIPSAMVVFNKPGSAVSDRLLADAGGPVDYECELCFVLGAGALVGVGVGLDLTKRDLQTQLKQQGLPWERAKAFDGSATFSQFVPVPADLSVLSFTLHIEGALVQQGDPGLMIYPPQAILTELAGFMSLQDNDILMTGTPKGVGRVSPGAEFVARLYDREQLLIEHAWTGQAL